MPPSDPFTTPDYSRCALITVDVQKEFLPGGNWELPGTTEVLPAMGQLCHAFRQAGRPIVHILRIYTADAADVDRCRRQAMLDGAPLLLKGAEGRRPADALLPDPQVAIDDDLLMAGNVQAIGPQEVLIYKPRWGAFYRTPLEAWLRDKEISTLVFTGFNFPNCPRTSIYQASERDFRIVAVTDAISGLQPADVVGLEGIGVNCLTAKAVAEAVLDSALGDSRSED